MTPRARRGASPAAITVPTGWILTLLLIFTALAPNLAIAQTPVPSCAPLQSATPVSVPETLPEIPPVEVPEGATQVTMGYTPASIFAPVFVALDKGYFAEQGLDVELQALAGGSDMVVLTATGEFDAGIAGTGPGFWNGVNQGLPITIIAPGHAEGSPVATPLMISREACEAGTYTSVADLEGEQVSVNARGATEYWLDAALGTAGLTIDDIDLQTLAFPDAVTALGADALAGAMIGEPLATQAEQQGIAVRLLSDFPVQDIQPTMIFGNQQFLQENPDAAAGLVAGYLKAAQDLTENFNDPLNLAIIEKYTNVPAALIAQSVKPVYSTDGAIDLDSLMVLQEFFRERDQLDYETNIDPASIVDMQYVERARELLGQ